jgi:Tfp pilus assembly protein PilO
MKPRDRLVLAIVGVAALAAAFWFLELAPKRERASALGAQVAQAEVRRDTAAAKAVHAEDAKADYAADYATVARLGKAVPPQADVPSLVFQIESAARGSKVDFRKVTVEDTAATAPGAPAPATTSGISPRPVSFTFEGSFFALQRMLREIDRFSRVKGTKVSVSGRLLTLDQVKLSAGRAGLPAVKAEITAKAYVAPVPSALPGQTAPQTASTTAPATPTTAPAAQVTP